MLDPLVSPDPGFFGGVTPALPVILAGVLALLVPDRFAGLRKGLMLAAPLVAFAFMLAPQYGIYGQLTIGGFDLVTMRKDGLALVFGLVFVLAILINGVYGLHERSRLQDAAALIYGGAALGAVFAGDLITLFVFWELLAVSSVFLIWGRGRASSVNAGLRYLAIHVTSGVLLLAGAIAVWADTNTFVFGEMAPEGALEPFFDVSTPGGAMILLAFGIKCAFPFLHNWLQDAYPKATVVGAVVLSAFTTKVAIYALARGFAGFEPLIYIGAVMTVFPVFFAVIENDLRRVLSYSINNQLGFMVCGIGVGTALGVNGAAAHAFADVLFKGLLFMSMGAVLHRVGTTRATDLGGLYKSMPITAFFCIIGAMSISAFPLFSAFVTKSMILAAVAEEHYWLPFLMLLFASAGVLEHAGIKIPYFAFFAHDSGRRPREAPTNMLIAMAIAAFMCIYIGSNPSFLYGILPYPFEYQPYTTDHILTQMQLVLAAVFAFALLMRLGLYPPERRVVILDFDWVYRKFGWGVAVWSGAVGARLAAHAGAAWGRFASDLDKKMHAVFSPAGGLSRAVPNGVLAVWTALILGAALLVTFLAPL